MSTNDSRGRGGGPSTGTTGYIGIPKQPQGGTTTYGGVPSETVYGNDEHMNQETGVVTKDEQSGWQEIRQKYIRVYCEESNVETKAGRKQCEKVCEVVCLIT